MAKALTVYRGESPPGEIYKAPGLLSPVRRESGAGGPGASPLFSFAVCHAIVNRSIPLTDQGRNHVFVASDRGIVEQRKVKLGVRHDGLRAVTEGLKENAWVVVDGIETVQAGMTVKPERVTMPTRSETPRNEHGQ